MTRHEVSRALLEEGVATMGAVAAGLFLLDDGGANLELTVAVKYPEPLADRYRLVPLSANVPLVDTVKTSAPIFVESLAEYAARYPEFARSHPEIARNAFVSLPLVLDGRCVGALLFGFGAARSFTTGERESLVALAARCARELDRLQRLNADRAAQRSAARRSAALEPQRLERLHAFTGTLAQATTPAQVVEAVVDMGLAASSARSVALWLRSSDGASVVLSRKVGVGVRVRSDGLPPEGLARIELDGPARAPVLDAVRDGAAVWIESRSQLEERYPVLPERFPATGKDSFACVPLLVQGRCTGALTYGFEGTHRFLEDERSFLQVISWYAAQALERASLYAAEKGAKERALGHQRLTQLISDIDMLLASSLDDSNILAEVARAAVPRFADWCVLELAVQRLGGPNTVASHVDPSKVPLVLEMRARLREMPSFSQGLAAVMRSGFSQLHASLSLETISNSVGASGPLVELAREVGAASCVVVPISARGQVLGALLLGRAERGRAYDDQDLAVAEDLGRRIGLAVDNARLYQEARDANRLKDEFLAMLSHELRNPLAPIVTALDLMDSKGEPHFAREREMISRHVGHLLRLLEDLLDVARITRGKVQVVTERCELASIVAAAVEVASPLVEQRGHRLEVSGLEPGLPVIADHARLTQAIANLVTNAAKYTAPGGTIAVRATADGSDAVVSVRDSGMGIAPELIPRIFDPFVQGASGLDRSLGGLGLGLTVARSVVSLHGGTLSAHSAGLGHGSEFVVRLPRAEPAVAVPAPPPPGSARRTTGDRTRVLVVDDNHDAAGMLGQAIEALGGSALVVYDGESALTSVATFEPQLVLLDIGLPGMDGYEVARRLREVHRDLSLRIIAVTGYGQPSDRQRSRVAGFDEHLVKPVSIDVLRQVLDPNR